MNSFSNKLHFTCGLLFLFSIFTAAVAEEESVYEFHGQIYANNDDGFVISDISFYTSPATVARSRAGLTISLSDLEASDKVKIKYYKTNGGRPYILAEIQDLGKGYDLTQH